MAALLVVDPRLGKFEEDLRKIPGVRGARVVGNEAPTEIHIVAAPGRSAKQVVRDVQSLAAAGFGMPIDHRIVSIVQLDDELGSPLADALSNRPVLERIVLASKGAEGWVKVALRWPDGEMTEGVGATGATREARAKGAASAVQRALNPFLEKRRSSVEIDEVVIQRLGSGDSVTVRAVFSENGAPRHLVGSALVYDDVASAAVRATLQAVNRKLV
jgi:hypothetical protein